MPVVSIIIWPVKASLRKNNRKTVYKKSQRVLGALILLLIVFCKYNGVLAMIIRMIIDDKRTKRG